MRNVETEPIATVLVAKNEGRPATNDDGPLAPNPNATRGAVVSMPAASPPVPARTRLQDPMSLAECIAELTEHLRARED